VVCRKGAEMERNSDVREMEPVKCRVTEVTSLQDSGMLGTYGGILHTPAVMYMIDACTHVHPMLQCCNSYVPKLYEISTRLPM
jgi:hypothetical protein